MASSYYDHGLALGLTWFLVLLVNLASVRWFSHLWNKSIVVHAVTGWLITGITLGYVWSLPNGLHIHFHISEPHKFIGTLYVILIIPIAFTGLCSLLARKFVKWNTKVITLLRRTHKYATTALIIISLI